VALEFIRGFALPDKDTTIKPWVDKIMRPSLSRLVKDGYLELPEGPGWGVDIDENELAKHPYIEPCQWFEKRKKSFRNDFNLSRPSK
jgi:hypothetical protein